MLRMNLRHGIAMFLPATYLSLASVANAQQASSEASSAVLEEIVITAQKRTERLADTPVAASVVAAATLQSFNAGDISDRQVRAGR